MPVINYGRSRLAVRLGIYSTSLTPSHILLTSTLFEKVMEMVQHTMVDTAY